MCEIKIKLRCRNCQWGWFVDVETPIYICPECNIDTSSYNKFNKEDSLEWCQAKIKQLEEERSVLNESISEYDKGVNALQIVNEQLEDGINGIITEWDTIKGYDTVNATTFENSIEVTADIRKVIVWFLEDLKALEGKDEKSYS